MYSLIKLLRNIGLSEKEAVTYCITLKVGSNPASIIAKNANFNRGTTYFILETLIKKGLISQFEKNQTKYFSAIEPTQLIAYINEKNRDLMHYKDEIIDFLPEFEALKHRAQISPRLKSYTGKVGITKIFNEVLEEDKIDIWALPASKQHSFFIKSPIFDYYPVFHFALFKCSEIFSTSPRTFPKTRLKQPKTMPLVTGHPRVSYINKPC